MSKHTAEEKKDEVFINYVMGEKEKIAYPTAAVGWICPVCGGGMAPSASRCPCVPVVFTPTVTY